MRPLALERAYAIRVVRQRLHQRSFGEMVLGAYRCRCAVCNLGCPLPPISRSRIPARFPGTAARDAG